jgi:putative ABC transport system substrate-binding protein
MLTTSSLARFATALLLLSVSLAAPAQPAGRVYRIGFITPLSGSPEPPTLRAFREGLRELGYVEGRNLVLETRFGDGHNDRLPAFAAELVGLKVDVLLAGSDVGAIVAKKATATIPIVFAGVSDPLDKGIVTSLARPGGNLTGISVGIGGSGLGGKRVALLKEAFPHISRIAILQNPGTSMGTHIVKEAQDAAPALGVKLEMFYAANAAELDRALSAIGASGVQGLVVANDPFFVDNRKKIVQFAASRRLPAMYFFRLFVDAGGLMAYSASLEDSYRRAATYVDKILKGARPAELPVELPTRFELDINRGAAKAQGLAIPQSLLPRADYVVD